MQKIGTIRAGLILGAALTLGLVAAFYAARSNGATAAPDTSQATRLVVKSAKNKTLGKTILVTRKGMTLARTEPDVVPSLHRCASSWYRDAGLVVEAANHARGQLSR